MEPGITITEQVARVVVQNDGTTLVVVEPETTTVEVGVIGPQGPQGPQGVQGPQGPQGTPGAASGSYEHVQGVPSAEWTIVHNLGFYPNIAVFDSLGRQVFGGRQNVDINTVVMTFSGAFSGRATAS